VDHDPADRVDDAPTPRVILHLDMDAFFASVEIQRHPELRGRPVVVGGDGPRGVVAAASYEARAYGVFSAMPSVRARRLCPDAVFLHGDHAHYSAVSRRIMAVLTEVTPLVEPLSLDEAFCDVTGVLHAYPDVKDLGTELRRRIRIGEGLECAVGVGPSKFVAKLASKRAKPRIGRPGSGPEPGVGVLVVGADEQRAFLDDLGVQEIWGVGPATLRRLTEIGVTTIGELATIPRTVLERRFGRASGAQLHALARGIDPRRVVADRAPKSLGHEETYERDLVAPERLRTEILRLADATAARLREHDLVARTVHLKVRFADFTTITRSRTFASATGSSRQLAVAARHLLADVDVGRGVRLLGVTASNLGHEDSARQLALDVDADASWRQTEKVVDDVRARFGADAIASAALISDGSLDVRRRGDQQWGRAAPGRSPDDAE
jgi:DNA polymerase-4